jgi:hypothetical protein
MRGGGRVNGRSTAVEGLTIRQGNRIVIVTKRLHPLRQGTDTNTMNTEAIERIKGYCCEVTQEQWNELVRVADEVGVRVGGYSRGEPVKNIRYARLLGDTLCHRNHKMRLKEIPFPDFLAKLQGEKWQPKAGELVEVSDDQLHWVKREFLTVRDGKVVCWDNAPNAVTYRWLYIRPLPPTITRTEAERLLSKRIID